MQISHISIEKRSNDHWLALSLTQPQQSKKPRRESWVFSTTKALTCNKANFQRISKCCSPQIWVSHGRREASKPPARASSQNTHALFCFCRVKRAPKAKSACGGARAKIKTGRGFCTRTHSLSTNDWPSPSHSDSLRRSYLTLFRSHYATIGR